MNFIFLDSKDKDEDAIAMLCDSVHYQGFLNVMAYFSNYSWRNIFLIYQQMPHATKLADFDTWKKTYGRGVKFGTTAIKINAPIEQKPKTRLIAKTDPTTGEVMLDDNGKRIMEEKIIAQPPRFELVRLLDVSQTKGEPLPILAGNVTANELLQQAFIDVLRAMLQTSDMLGADSDIWKVVKHITHERLANLDITGTNALDFIVASVAFVVCHRFGVDYDFDPADTNIIDAAILEIITKQSNGIISTIEDNFTLLCDERNLDPMTLPKAAEPISKVEPAVVSKVELPTETSTETPQVQLITSTQQAEQMAIVEPKPQPLKYPPDPTITVAERNQYGYTRPELLPLNKDRAIALFQRDMTVYMLHKNNTEDIAHYVSDIQNHDGIFGIAHRNWQNSREYIALSSGNPEDRLEGKFIFDGGNSFAVYQVKEDNTLLCFKSYEELKAMALDISRHNYKLVYTAPLPPSDTPEGIFMWVNAEQLDDYKGRAMAISDVVSIKKDGVITSYYANGRTFKELLDFVGEEGRRPRAVEVVAVVETEPQAKQETETPAPTTTESQSPQLPQTQTQQQTQTHPDTNTPPPPADTEPPPDLPKDRASVDVYRLSRSDAEKHNALPTYELSRKIDVECAQVISESIQHHKEGKNIYDFVTPAEILLEEYGKNRMLWVLSKHILARLKGFTQDNLTWADKIVNDGTWSGDNEPAFVINTHHAVIDAFVTELQNVLDQEHSFSYKLRKAKQKSDAHNNSSG